MPLKVRYVLLEFLNEEDISKIGKIYSYHTPYLISSKYYQLTFFFLD